MTDDAQEPRPVVQHVNPDGMDGSNRPVVDVDQADEPVALGELEDDDDPKELADPGEPVAEPWDEEEESTDGQGD